ncbi:ABC transporter substrate-binding protein [Pseudovibrio sp. Ad26]|uniref:ABC transporter substrate-binding protein n=1 Tax=Pseudovibrio sp. Ad26 TaxID=989410 RepID=UPI0007AE384F|nr:ABC transporter substrate-binding protein [Pseudovibrio sp. Ad26]KZL12722.1 putative sugar-binding periplasmic protein precursor [Pseudovibrio sp. Ad26]
MKILNSASALAIAAMTFAGGTAFAAEKELVIFNWLGGSERDLIIALEEGFTAKYPDYEIKDINPAAGGDDPRSGIRSAMLSGEEFDLLLNTWPSFEKELVAADLISPIDAAWEQYGWSSALNDSWRNLAKHDGKTYGAYFIAGNRSGVWYRPDTLAKAGIAGEPTQWKDFLSSFSALKEIGMLPVSIGARSWAQTEWFENALLRTAGPAFAKELSEHKVPWTDDRVKETFRNLRDMLEADCCAEPGAMLSSHWTDAADAVLKNKKAGFMLIGSWANQRAKNEYGLTPIKDYSYMQFPVIKPEYGNAMSVDGKNFLVMKQAKNPDGAELFIDFVLSKEGSAIIAAQNLATPSANVDPSSYDPIVRKYAQILPLVDVFFVLDDLLPAELSGEFRIGLQKFLRDPSDASIDSVTAALDAKASELYQ